MENTMLKFCLLYIFYFYRCLKIAVFWRITLSPSCHLVTALERLVVITSGVSRGSALGAPAPPFKACRR